jgi:hypothetical protein
VPASTSGIASFAEVLSAGKSIFFTASGSAGLVRSTTLMPRSVTTNARGGSWANETALGRNPTVWGTDAVAASALVRSMIEIV